MIREKISDALKVSLKDKNQHRVAAIRLIVAALKKKDIDSRTADSKDGIPEPEILSLLQGMIKQRRESIEMYVKGGRQELADQEQAEIDVIQEFLPQALSEAELQEALTDAVKTTGAASVKDMGKVMAYLKEKYAGRIDFSTLAPKVKEKLGA